MPQSAVSHKTTRTKRAKSVTRSVPGTPRKKSKPAVPRTPRTPKKINRESDSQNVRDKISDDKKDETEGYMNTIHIFLTFLLGERVAFEIQGQGQSSSEVQMFILICK